MLPKARHAKLAVRELPEETLVYDLKRHKAHCLNRTSAFVWKHCDGATTVSELAEIASRKLGTCDEEVVHLALEQLSRRNLLEQPKPAISEEARQQRRVFLRRIAVTAAVLPVIMTMAVPKAAAQQSAMI